MFMKFAYTAMFVLFIVSSCLAVYWCKEKKKSERGLNHLAASYTNLQDAFEQTVVYSAAGPRLKIKYAKELDGDSTDLSTVFPKGEKKLVFRFRDDQCPDCIDSALSTLKEAAGSIGSANIVLLTTYHDISALSRYRKIKKIPFRIYNTDSEPFERITDDLKVPFLFVVDHGEMAELPLMIRSEDQALSRFYLSAVQRAFTRDYSMKYPITIEKTASIRFLRTVVDLGEVSYQGEARASFGFRNDGTKPLVITSVVTGCGCTVAAYRRQPVLGGDSSDIEISYDTQRTGTFDRTIYVYSNAVQSPTLIRLRGDVKKN